GLVVTEQDAPGRFIHGYLAAQPEQSAPGIGEARLFRLLALVELGQERAHVSLVGHHKGLTLREQPPEIGLESAALFEAGLESRAPLFEERLLGLSEGLLALLSRLGVPVFVA